MGEVMDKVAGFTPDNCPHCEYDRRWLGYGGWVYHGNNGPIVPCPLCNDDGAFTRYAGERASLLKAEGGSNAG